MKKSTIYTIVVMFLAIGLAQNTQAQKDTTEVKVGKKKIIIIENKTDKEREQGDLEAGRKAFEDLRDDAADKNGELKLEIIDLKNELSSAETDEKKAEIEQKIEAHEKKIAENDKKIEAFESGIAEIEIDLKDLEDEIGDLDDSFELEDLTSYKKKKKFNGHWAGFQMGLSNMLVGNSSISTPEELSFLELTPEKSFGYQLNFMEFNIPVFGQVAGFVTGAGIEWNSLTLAKNVDLNVDENGFLSASEIATDERDYEKNRLNMAYLTVPLIFEVQPWGKKSFHISAGATAGLRLWSKQKQTWYEGDRKNKYKNKDSFSLNPFRYGATAKIGYKNMALYANYNVSELFKNDYSQTIQPFTVGVSLINF